jgi:signal transduction histidine kinase
VASVINSVTSSASSRRLRYSLRLRLAVRFAVFGTLISLLLSIGIFVSARHTSDRLIDETLRAELEDYLARRARNPASLPPATASLRGYVYVPGRNDPDVPAAVLRLPTGRHQLVLDDVPYRIGIVDRGGERYVMMFNEVRQRQREQYFLVYLIAGVIVMTLVSAGLGWWLAGRVVAPVAELARLIGSERPEQWANKPGVRFSDDEVGALASGVFGEYVRRMRAFIVREQAFTADVSHELRTPLSIVQGVVELMETDALLNAQQRERIGRIRRAVREMIDVTSALLIMARESGAHVPVVEQCDVCDVVRDVVEGHRHLVSEKTNVRLTCDGQPHLSADGTLLKIVVANLVRNAFANTDSGTVTVAVNEGGVAVTDSGKGIPAEDIEKVFLRHFRGSDSGGAGIGLSLVRRICEKYGWDTVITSVVGQGTTAHLTFSSSTPKPASI